MSSREEDLLVLNLERLRVRAEVDLLRDGALARGVAHLEGDLLGLLAALVLAVVLVVTTLGLPDVSLDPARDLLLALAGEDGLVEGVTASGVLLLLGCQLGSFNFRQLPPMAVRRPTAVKRVYN